MRNNRCLSASACRSRYAFCCLGVYTIVPTGASTFTVFETSPIALSTAYVSPVLLSSIYEYPSIFFASFPVPLCGGTSNCVSVVVPAPESHRGVSISLGTLVSWSESRGILRRATIHGRCIRLSRFRSWRRAFTSLDCKSRDWITRGFSSCKPVATYGSQMHLAQHAYLYPV